NPDDPAPSKRQEIKQLIARLSAENPQVPDNIFHAMENVNLSVVLKYKLNGTLYNVLDAYDNEEQEKQEQNIGSVCDIP
ncbi:MAG: hypothetical protein IKM86_07990, partial [Acidaminococcaceae bacterium]|nr:hypothetical protein [Acidaminococcaceae bacterium]